MSAFNRFSHDDRQAPTEYRLPSHPQQPPPSYAQQPYTREAPRYDPSRQRDPMAGDAPGLAGMPGVPDPSRQPQVLDYAPKEGGPGTNFTATINIGNMDPSSRQFRFVFGSRRIGAFLEGRRNFNTCTLSAGVPRFEDTAWWSSKVPIYLLVVDPHTDQDLHSIQIGEFVYMSSPGRTKRARDEDTVGLPPATSPVRRANSTNSQRNPYAGAPGPYHDQPGQRLGHRPTASYASANSMHPSLVGGPSAVGGPSPYAPDRGPPGPVALQDAPLRYIAEPRDQYPSHNRAPSFSLSGLPSAEEHPYHPDSNRQHPSYLSVQQQQTPSPYSYQPSPTSATFRSPFSSTTNYMSPPHSATFAKSESSYDQPFPSADSEASSDTPTLQRTSTLSASSRRAPNSAAASGLPAGWMPNSKAKLDVMGNLDDMSRNWSGEEFAIRRRLVQFWRKQDGNIIRINFRPVEPGATRSPHAVIISCIYWEERQECFFTSVDAIFLLESLIGNRFAVEEKNRIRRNLEGFRPLTVGKGKPDSDNFFKLIMGFPAPKPRNIEKDVKAFPWRILTSALRKIIGKYSASYNGLTETTGTGSQTSASEVGASSAMLQQSPSQQGPSAASQQQQQQQALQPPQQRLMHEQIGQPGHGNMGGIAGGLGGEMPPPAMRRQHEMVSRGSPGQLQQQQRHSPLQGAPAASHAGVRSPSAQQAASASAAGGNKSPASSLSILVPPNPNSTLPSLDGLSNDLLDRRPSAGIPMSAGLGGLDFSDFMFASPGQVPSSTSGWPGSGPGSLSGPSQHQQQQQQASQARTQGEQQAEAGAGDASGPGSVGGK